MSKRTIHRILTLFALALAPVTISLAQTPTSPETPSSATWQVAQSVGSSKSKLFVVTLDQPHYQQACHVQSFTLDKLVCSRAVGGPRSYNPQQILALTLPGDGHLKLRLMLGLNAGLAAAIWGTVVLTATCPACAVATGIVALLLFGAAGAILIGDDQPDHLLYLAPNQQLTGRLRSVHF